MPESIKNIAIGSIVCVALALLVWILLFLHPSFGDAGRLLHVRFANVEKIYVGSRVTYAGKPVGKITDITMLPENLRVSDNGALYVYDVTMAIDSHINVYSCDEITVGTSGLMGERFIAIIPQKAPPGAPARLLTPDDVLYAAQAPSAEDTFVQLNKVIGQTESAMKDVAGILTENRANMRATIASLKSTSQNLDTIVSSLVSGDGSLGKLLDRDDFYLKTLSLIEKCDLLMQDVNHYGLLFHLDKSWQRERKRRQQEAQPSNETAAAIGEK